MSNLDLARTRNNTARLLNYQDRRWRNAVRFNAGNTKEHEMRKSEICLALAKDGKEFITEARFADGSGRADIVDLDAQEAIEIVNSETSASIEEKRKKYPIKIKVVLYE